MANENLTTYDWDDEVELTEDQERGGQETTILPDGKYPFEVLRVEKHFYDGGAKIPPCNMAKVFLIVDGGEMGKSLVVENIFLAEGYEWKAGAFLRSIGIRSHGDKLEFSKLLHCDGERGRCEIFTDEYEGRDGNTKKSNKLKKFFDKEEEAPKKAFKKGAF